MAAWMPAETRQPRVSQMWAAAMPPLPLMVLVMASQGWMRAYRREAGLSAAATAPRSGMEPAAFQAHRPMTPAMAPATPTVPTTLERVPRDFKDQCRPTMTQKAMKGIMAIAAR